MDFKFSKETEEKTKGEPAPADKGRQNGLLVLLLILVAGFAYLYFFTGLIRPQPEQKQATPPAPQVIKKPLPTPAGQAAVMKAASSAKATAAKTAPAVAPAGQPQAVTAVPKVEPSPTAPQVKSPAVAAKQQKPVEKGTGNEVKGKATPPPSKQEKPAVTPPAKVASTSVASKEKDKGANDKTSSPAKAKEKAASTAKAPLSKERAAKARVAAKPAKGESRASGPWTVVVGTYQLEDAMAADIIRVRKTGLPASVQPGGRKKTHMNRLFLSEHANREQAQAELGRLRKHTADAFMLEQGGKFAVFAGSYLLDARAGSERERLAGEGFQLRLQKVDVAVPSRVLTACSFVERDEAEAALAKLRAAGLKPSLVRQ